MAQTNNTTAPRNNEVVNPQNATADKQPTTLRVVETRDMWAVVFDHTATLLARAVNGEAMAQTNNTTAPRNNEVVNPQNATADKQPTTLRVVETRDMWAVVFDHTATLLARAVNGEAIEQIDQEGFAFGKRADEEGKTTRIAAKQQPNIQPYLWSLLAGFASRKGYKHAKGTALADRDLGSLAEQVFSSLFPKGDFANTVGKAEPKQAKSLIGAVIAKL